MDIRIRKEGTTKRDSHKDATQVEVYDSFDGGHLLGVIFLSSTDPTITVQVGSQPLKVEIQPDIASLITVYQKS